MLERLEYDIVRAKRFEIVGDDEEVRAAIGPGPDGATGLQLYSSSGEVRAELTVSDASTTFILTNESGSDIATLAVGEGTPTINLHRTGPAEESWAIGLAGENPEGPEVQRCSLLLSRGGKPQLTVTLLGEDGHPCLLMREGDDLVRVLP